MSIITLQSLFGVGRSIGTIAVDVILNEETNDTLTITKQPVQTGASMTDHSYLEPTILSMQILQQASPIAQLTSLATGGSFNPFSVGSSQLAELYEDFLSLQSSRTPFVVTTPKRIYQNMLIASLRCNTDKNTENILSLGLTFQQVFFANVGITTLIPSKLANASVNQATQNTGNNNSLLYNGLSLATGTPQ